MAKALLLNSAGAPTYLLHDQLGSTRLLTSSAGAVTATYTYDAYGNTTSHTGTATTPLLYAGQYQDTETGFYYLRNRYYDPATAQFLSIDPLVGETGQPYAYTEDDPVNATDPLGLSPWGWIKHHAANIAIGAAVVTAVIVVTVVTAGIGDIVLGAGAAAAEGADAAAGAAAEGAAWRVQLTRRPLRRERQSSGRLHSIWISLTSSAPTISAFQERSGMRCLMKNNGL